MPHSHCLTINALLIGFPRDPVTSCLWNASYNYTFLWKNKQQNRAHTTLSSMYVTNETRMWHPLAEMCYENVEHLKVRLRQLMNKFMDVVHSQCPRLLLCVNTHRPLHRPHSASTSDTNIRCYRSHLSLYDAVLKLMFTKQLAECTQQLYNRQNEHVI